MNSISSQGSNFEFTFEDKGLIRVINIDGDPWFVGTDICKVLGIRNPSAAYSRLDPDERSTRKLETAGGTQNTTIISESGLYGLVMSSRKHEVQPFKRWVRKEVLPEIRKTGSYSVTSEAQLSARVENMNLEWIKALYPVMALLSPEKDAQALRIIKTHIINRIVSEEGIGPQTPQISNDRKYTEPRLLGAVDIALLLGFRVPKEYESSLGKHVKQECSHLLCGQDGRFSAASDKFIHVNMYPEDSQEVRDAVEEYCTKKAFRRNGSLVSGS